METMNHLDETALILTALNQSMPKKRTKKVMFEIEPSIMSITKKDIVSVEVEKIKRKKKQEKRPIRNWTNLDFLRYFDTLLKTFDVRLKRGISIPESKSIGELYDALVPYFKDNMNNEKLRDYIDWWCNIYARSFHNKDFYTSILTNNYYIQNYIKNQVNLEVDTSSHEIKTNKKEDEVDDIVLYKISGLSMLVMSRGIIAGYNVLLSEKEQNPMVKLSGLLRSFSKDVLTSVMDKTISCRPYRQVPVDFISLARQALDFYGIKKYSNLSYKDYFEV